MLIFFIFFPPDLPSGLPPVLQTGRACGTLIVESLVGDKTKKKQMLAFVAVWFKQCHHSVQFKTQPDGTLNFFVNLCVFEPSGQTLLFQTSLELIPQTAFIL